MADQRSTRASGRALLLLLGVLSTLGPFSNDTLLPNFPYVQGAFEVSALTMQQTLTVYFIPFAVMMLLHGTLSDAFGRRRVIMIGVGVYALAALVCATATTFEGLLVGRVLQGLSAGAGIVVGRAIVRDLYADQEAQRALAVVMIIFGVAPGIAPIIGGWLGHLFGWRSVFLFLSLVAATLLALAALWLPETLPRARRVPLSLREVAAGFREAFGSARFVLLAAAFGMNFAGFFIYIVASPAFGYDILRLDQTEFVWIFGPAIAGMMLGSFFANRMAGRVSLGFSIAIAYGAMVGAAAFNVGYHARFPATLPISVLPIFAYNIGLGLAMPVIMLLAMDLMPRRRGLASSMIGFSQSGFSALLAGAIAPLVSTTALSLAACGLAMALCGLASWGLYFALSAAHGRRVRV